MEYRWQPPKSDKNVIPENLEEFFRFIYERQAIWYRRFELKLPREDWTDDPILKKYKYTNVYRHLDRGTIWMFDNVLMPTLNRRGKLQKKLEDAVWRICQYRLLNKVETFEKVSLISHKDYGESVDRADFFDTLADLLEQGEKVWTSAHITLQCNLNQGRLSNYEEILDRLWFSISEITEFMQSHDMEQSFKRVKQEYGFGPFITFEVLSDFVYIPAFNFTQNDWANPGPGCKLGINLIYPNVKTIGEYQNVMDYLCKKQNMYFKRYKLPWKEVRYKGQRLSLRDIEHSLCEYGKLHKQKLGVGKARMIFVPKTKVE